MTYSLYPLVKVRNGRKLGEFSLGTLGFNADTGLEIFCPDAGVKRRLDDFFSSPLLVRQPLGSATTVMTYTWKELEPGTEEHFKESLTRLHTLGIMAKLDKESS